MYVLNGVNSWRHVWRKNDWTLKIKNLGWTTVANADLWQILDRLAESHVIGTLDILTILAATKWQRRTQWHL